MLVCVCKNWKGQCPGHPGAEHIPHTTLCPSKQECGGLLELSQDMLNSPLLRLPESVCHVQAVPVGH